MLFFAAVAACVLATVLFVTKANLWWFIALGLFALLAQFGLELSRLWDELLSSSSQLFLWLGFFRLSNPEKFASNRREHVSEAQAHCTAIGIRYFSAGILLFLGLGLSLLHLYSYAGIPGAFLAEVGVAQAFLNLYTGLLGAFLLVQTRQQQLSLKPLTS